MNNLYKSNLIRGHCAQSALGMNAVDRVMFEGSPTIEKMEKTLQNTCFKRKFLKCPQSLRECCAIKTVCTFFTTTVRNDDFQLNFGFGLWWLHFFPFEMFTGAVTFKHESFELDLEPPVLRAKRVNFHEFP